MTMAGPDGHTFGERKREMKDFIVCKNCPHRMELITASFEDTLFVCLFCSKGPTKEEENG